MSLDLLAETYEAYAVREWWCTDAHGHHVKGRALSTIVGSLDLAYLRTAGLALILEISPRSELRVRYWGKDLGELEAQDVVSMSVAGLEPHDVSAPEGTMAPGAIPLSSSGWTGRPGIAGHRPTGSGWAPMLRILDAEVCGSGAAVSESVGVRKLNGRDGEPDCDASGNDVTVACAGAGTVHVRMEDPDAGLLVEVWFELLEEGILRARASAENRAGTPYFLDELSLAFPVPVEADEVLDFSGYWGRERTPQRTTLGLGCHLREGRHGRTGFDSPDMMFCGERGFSFENGRLWGLHVAGSGNHRAWIDRCPDGNQVLGGGELLLPGEIQLEKGDRYTSPWIYLEHTIGLDEAAQRLHRWERRLPSHPEGSRPIVLNVWEAVYFEQDSHTLKQLADRASAVGVERFVLDDGWFLGRRNDRAGLGDWTVDPDVWPTGLGELIDHVTGLGMEFGLWVEPEMINLDSDLARAHPDWILRAGSDYPREWRHQQVLNLANPQAWDHIHERLGSLLDEYAISYLKWDHNRDLIAAGDPSQSGRAVVHSQTEAVYRLMDTLRSEHPGLEIESCASGGGRIDLGMIEHVQRFWISDCIDPHERQSIARWTGQLLAPEYMGTHIASPKSHTTGRVSDLSFRAGTALWGHMGFEWNLLDLKEHELRELAEWVSFYKDHESLLLGGDVVRRDVGNGSIWLHGVVSHDQSRALFELTTRDRSTMSPFGRFPIPGLAPQSRYSVAPAIIGMGPSGLVLPQWAIPRSGIVLTGSQLAESGLQTPTMDPDQVLLLDVTAVEV